MLVRSVFMVMLLAVPFRAQADGYVVQAGDTLGNIARKYHVSVSTLARFNHIVDANVIQIGRLLGFPRATRTYRYHVRWGDTLIGISATAHVAIATIRSLNPTLGRYPLAGQYLTLCGPCGGAMSVRTAAAVGVVPVQTNGSYSVRPGDTLISIAGRFGTTTDALLAANRLLNPNLILAGMRVYLPAVAVVAPSASQARSTIAAYARYYGIDPSLPLAIGWQESGFNQGVTSRTGAVGVMQVEPYTAIHIASQWGRPVHLEQLDDNIHAGVYWLSRLLDYYGGDQRLAVAAYYQGTRAISRYGFFQDTVQYVRNVQALQSEFGL